MSKPLSEFERRKKEQLQSSLKKDSQSQSPSGLENITLSHEAFPDLDFEEVNIETRLFSSFVSSPFFVSSMTAGHEKGESLNAVIAKLCEKRKWAMGLGSQKKQLFDPESAYQEWKKLREAAPSVLLMSNIGLTEVIRCPSSEILDLARAIGALALIVHTNPLQECFQDGSEARFKGGFKALERLVEASSFPIVIKETGCGFSLKTLKRLKDLKLGALDLAGLGGTHWGIVEGGRSQDKKKQKASKSFASWGINTVDSLKWAMQVRPPYDIWASGGVRSGLDAAKLMALGADMVGIAQPLMKAAVEGESQLSFYMETLEFELKVALFCTGCKNLKELKTRKL